MFCFTLLSVVPSHFSLFVIFKPVSRSCFAPCVSPALLPLFLGSPWSPLLFFFFFFFFHFFFFWFFVFFLTFFCIFQRCLAFGFFFCLAITITKLLCLTLPNSRHMKFRAVFHRSAWPALLFFFSGSSPTQIHNLLLLTTHTKSASTFLCWTINQFLCCR